MQDSPPPAATPTGFAKTRGGYDRQAVDQFLDTLASDGAGVYGQPTACSWPFASEEPPVWDRPGPRPRRARRPRAARRQYARDCDAGWLRVSDLPGTRLRCTREQVWLFPPKQIVSSDGQVLLTRRGATWTVAASGQRFLHPDQQVVDAATGRPILQQVGNHISRQAKAVVLRHQQRWFRFPVEGSRLRNGVMTAVDESDTEVLWFRKTGRRATEVVISPQCALTPEILCVIELAAPWLDIYLAHQGGTVLASGPSVNPPARKPDASEDTEDRLQVTCVECGAETAGVAALCVQCGAPVIRPRSRAAGPEAARLGDSRTAATARDADRRQQPAKDAVAPDDWR
jgi:DivIVA domain-containing protein